MDWIFDNLQILVFIAAGVAFWLNSLRQAREEAEQDHEHDDRPVDVEEIFGPNFDFNERPPQSEVFLPPPVTTSQAPAAPPPLPGQAAQPRVSHARDFPTGSPMPQRPVSPHQTPTPDSHSAELERQRKLDERLRSLRQHRDSRPTGAAATQRSVEAKRAARKGVVAEEAADPTSLGGIRSRLRSSREARRAIVMREILDTPVGMR